jgi:hypothetical protein
MSKLPREHLTAWRPYPFTQPPRRAIVNDRRQVAFQAGHAPSKTRVLFTHSRQRYSPRSFSTMDRHEENRAAADPLRGKFFRKVGSKSQVVEYEPDSKLCNTERVPLLEPGGIPAVIEREVLPYAKDAWFGESSFKIGYAVSFTRDFWRSLWEGRRENGRNERSARRIIARFEPWSVHVMTASEFLRPRLCGTRFDGGTIPLEVLADFAVLEEMVAEVAKWRFLQDHPERRRSPRNFTEGLDLKLTGVDEGSAVPVIVLRVASMLLPVFPNTDLSSVEKAENQLYFEKARDSIIAAVGAAEQGQDILSHLPEKCLVYFDRLGRSLRQGEAIEFNRGSEQRPARLTPESRQRLLVAANMPEITGALRVRGSVFEFDDEKATFQLQLLDGRKLLAPVPAQFRDMLLESLGDRRKGARVLVKGVGRFDRNRRALGFASIEHVTPLEPLDVPSRIDELRSLEDGWLDGHGKAPPTKGLNWFAQTFEERFPDSLPLPHVYPTEDGGIRAEWSIDSREMSLDVDLESHLAAWHCWCQNTDADEGASLDLAADEGWRDLARLVSGSMKEADR